jgi:hypothetical protein
MSELNFVIDVSSGEDSDLKDFLRQHGVSASPNYGVQNAWPMPDVTEIVKHPAPYLLVGAAVHVLNTAIQAYASTKKKRIIINRLAKGGIKIDATNWTAEELNKLNLDYLDFVSFESTKKKTDDD